MLTPRPLLNSRTHDPTDAGGQGNDRGTQYRSAIFAHSPEQLEIANKVTAEVQELHHPKKKIATLIETRPAGDFFEADSYHQEYLFKHPNGYHCKFGWGAQPRFG